MPPFVHINKAAPVLIVEDEPYIATEIEHMLIDFGFEKVEVFLTYSAAAERVAKGGFELAIFDINVGGMLSFCLISDAAAQGAAVITMSGYLSFGDAIDGRVFLPKPITPDTLSAAIAKAHHARVVPDVVSGSSAVGRA